MKENLRLSRLTMLAMMVAIGVVISPIPRIEGMCPTAHLINTVCVVFLGPSYASTRAFTIGTPRMTPTGIPSPAPTGTIFGVALSGILYRLSGGKLIFVVTGETIDTGIINALVSYPVMTLLIGKQGIGWAFYISLFLEGTPIGGSTVFVFSSALAEMGMLTSIQEQLGAKMYNRSHKSNIHNV